MSRFKPGPHLLLGLALLVLFALLPLLAYGQGPLAIFGQWAEVLVPLLAGAFVLLTLADLAISSGGSGITLERSLPHSLALQHPINITLTLRHKLARPVMVRLVDGAPARGRSQPEALELELRPGQFCQSGYRFTPTRRGPARFAPAYLSRRSYLGFWQLFERVGELEETRVYPNFAAVSGFQLLAQDHQAGQIGIRRRPRRGEGLEFHQLRDYRPGDSLRQIDWKATARRTRLIAREYQDERDQQVVLLIDSGRRMLTREGLLNHFDHSLNALLLLGFVALRQGDAVGFMGMGPDPRWLQPAKGRSYLNTLLNCCYDLEPGTYPSDYLQAAQKLMEQQRKRALVVLATNLRDELLDELIPALRLLRRRHLVLVANLQEGSTRAAQQQPVSDFSGALAYLGAEDYLQRRRRLGEVLQSEGVLFVDCTPEELAPRVVNQYLDIKRAGSL